MNRNSLFDRLLPTLPEGFSYTSDNNTEWLDLDGIKKYIAPFEALYTQGKLEG